MSELGKNVVSQHMSWTFLPPFYCAWFSITENDIRLIRKLWFITFNNYPGLSLYSCLKWWSQWWFDPVAISLDISKFLAAVVQWLIVINLQPCIQRVHSYFNYRWLIWEFRKYYPYTVGEARMRLFPKIWEPKHGRCSRGRPATTFIDQQTGMGDISVRVHLKLIYYRSIHYREYNYSYS